MTLCRGYTVVVTTRWCNFPRHRDRDGLVQVVMTQILRKHLQLQNKARQNFYKNLAGRVRRRYAGAENANMVASTD